MEFCVLSPYLLMPGTEPGIAAVVGSISFAMFGLLVKKKPISIALGFFDQVLNALPVGFLFQKQDGPRNDGSVNHRADRGQSVRIASALSVVSLHRQLDPHCCIKCISFVLLEGIFNRETYPTQRLTPGLSYRLVARRWMHLL